MTQEIIVVIWCNVCNAERAATSVEAQINEQWVNLDIGPRCLTRMEDEGKIEM